MQTCKHIAYQQGKNIEQTETTIFTSFPRIFRDYVAHCASSPHTGAAGQRGLKKKRCRIGSVFQRRRWLAPGDRN
jgi:ATP phosphoribosyltransferase